VGKPLIDVLHPVDTKDWRRNLLSESTRRAFRETRTELRKSRYQWALDFQGSIKSAVAARWLSKTRQVYGFATPRERLAAYLYATRVRTSRKHVIEQNVELVSAFLRFTFGRNVTGNVPASLGLLPRDPQAEAAVNDRLALHGTRFAILSPAAGWSAKQWPAERFGEVAQWLAREGIPSWINIGPGERESQMADIVEHASTGAARRMQCSISQLIALTRRASLFIGSDTGPMHLANALGVPVIAIFGPTDPARNGPYYNPHVVLRSSLSQTSYSHVDRPDSGILSISVDQVTAAARQLLTRL
jgi:heptosyltransferase-1